uniref:helicase SKI2W-like n=1 Tax=Styela clava TaxID=7725 RepID=UPI00193A082A|nr:helicase SKI2W-like [Styela clava]
MEMDKNTLEYKFAILETPNSGQVTFIKDEHSNEIFHPTTLFPAGLPPVYPSLLDEVQARFLEDPERLDIHDFRKTQRIWDPDVDIESLYSMNVCPVNTSLQVERNPTSGELLGYFEERIDALENSANMTSKNSWSMLRAPGPPSEATRGSSTNYPFWPGGMEEALSTMMREGPSEVDFEEDFLTCPPGFESGVDFGKHGGSTTDSQTLNITDLIQDVDNHGWILDDVDTNNEKIEEKQKDEITLVRSNSLEDILKKDSNDENKKLVSHEESTENTLAMISPVEEWAVNVDISKPVSEWSKIASNMAHKYPFELDTFQKQAIVYLENHQSVFVAAHTSAGKTVVAEYAIALAKKHMTRVVYTSPIKALSNQKYRDFKTTFDNVGLLTGDVQLHPEGFCLIMTTEILRSMLYNGSEVIRDLEWVIFDEVHYINDAERGVVWEEVLIMLPEHCNVILLSATVPNTLEFANWVGRTKKKKIHVISTLKRPVPLEHFLYTGNSNKTSNELFLLLDHNRNFQTTGYTKAIDAKKERTSKHQKSFGAKSGKGATPGSDKGVWLSIVERLRKKEQLPVVAFTFSRKRCDDNASMLTSLDLTSSAEKSEIHIFFNKCVQKLKGSDRKLPQVTHMSGLLQRGIGVHHSGILPILKEVIEMLFTRGLVKLLFATETFAMGVNMPARTVVFDSIRKHDGTCMRELHAGEYIQMAGRAGRRGKDTTGTVIILCKGDVPEISDLHKMMLGRPTKLESQFRLTYGMILNLLRVEELRVQDMMKRSFAEFHSRKDSKEQEKRLKELISIIKSKQEIADVIKETDFGEYYDSCIELLELRERLQNELFLSSAGLKNLQPGRVLVLDTEKYKQHLAVSLKIDTSGKDKKFLVLVLCEKSEIEKEDTGEHKLSPQSILRKSLFRPEISVGQEIVTIYAEDISYLTTCKLDIKADRIIDDYTKRQIPRFRDDPPSQSTSVATQELLRLIENNPNGLSSLDPRRDFDIKRLELVEDLSRIEYLENMIQTGFSCVDSGRFNSILSEVEEYMKVKKELDNLKYLLSDESLHLLPEYQDRVQVLKELRYIDEREAVQLKGRVACEISSHELVLTELVFENVLSPLEPEEIVALLSSAVFQKKMNSFEIVVPPCLEKGMNKIIQIATEIGEVQRHCGIRQPTEDFVSELKFGLTLVVYEWAKGTSFQEITNFTEVQEGVIVRTIQRLNETCRDIRNAARVIGDPGLYQKMEKCSELIKRDIVFAASLYTQ